MSTITFEKKDPSKTQDVAYFVSREGKRGGIVFRKLQEKEWRARQTGAPSLIPGTFPTRKAASEAVFAEAQVATTSKRSGGVVGRTVSMSDAQKTEVDTHFRGMTHTNAKPVSVDVKKGTGTAKLPAHTPTNRSGVNIRVTSAVDAMNMAAHMDAPLLAAYKATSKPRLRDRMRGMFTRSR